MSTVLKFVSSMKGRAILPNSTFTLLGGFARTGRADGADALIGAARKCIGSERARAFGLGVN